MSTAVPFKDADQRLQQLHAYWQGKRRGREMPARADIDPVELGPLLPYLMLIDVEAGPRFRYRLFGTAVAEAMGQDPTGRYIDEVMVGQYRAFLLGLYGDLVARKKPVYSTSIYGAQQRREFWTQRLMLPLSSDGRVVDMVLAGQVFVYGSPLKTLTVRLAQDADEPITHLSAILD